MNKFQVEQQPVTRASFLTSTVCVRTSALLSSLVVKVCVYCSLAHATKEID